jgi:hypothetical protein
MKRPRPSLNAKSEKSTNLPEENKIIPKKKIIIKPKRDNRLSELSEETKTKVITIVTLYYSKTNYIVKSTAHIRKNKDGGPSKAARRIKLQEGLMFFHNMSLISKNVHDALIGNEIDFRPYFNNIYPIFLNSFGEDSTLMDLYETQFNTILEITKWKKKIPEYNDWIQFYHSYYENCLKKKIIKIFRIHGKN